MGQTHLGSQGRQNMSQPRGTDGLSEVRCIAVALGRRTELVAEFQFDQLLKESPERSEALSTKARGHFTLGREILRRRVGHVRIAEQVPSRPVQNQTNLLVNRTVTVRITEHHRLARLADSSDAKPCLEVQPVTLF
ncbi:hypothetical protein E1202_01920 [Saccharopolyspora karakumensis]|uniref:Uncharacterized protein n=1 Tax=Saccharopolyspora karakumensis TaxID=2530386 RepID=A0A4R5C485_9PSEU|nr:hypothetical protein [Saccharopolyspora karakumensis]TDD92760.1 hypothetical protein E1202_01920 [Saccharopolyspora karakumensis]